MKSEINTGVNELTHILDILWRRKWIILVPFIIISIVVTLWGLYLPSIYRSSVSIFVEPQKVPEDYVRSTITSDMESRIRTIKQQLTSRTKLLQVISELDLYPVDAKKKAPDEVLVSQMREDLEIDIPNESDLNFFMVHYNHENPTKAMLGVSRLVSLFIVESLQIREEQAVGTTRFLEEELSNVKLKLETQEETIQSFKHRHIGELPNQLSANLSMLENLNLQLQDNIESKREFESRILLLEQEIAKLQGGTNLPSINGDGAVVGGSTLARYYAQRVALTQEVAHLESIYTPRHPDLIAAKKALEKNEADIISWQRMIENQGKSSKQGTQIRQTEAFSPELMNLRRQLTESKPRLSALLAEENDLRRKISMYQSRVENVPKREQQLLSLTRDYENTKQNYQDLLKKKLEAQLAQNLEKRQEGEKFRVLDPANLPEKPFEPNRKKIIFLGIFGGLGLGIALAFLLESLFPAFYNIKPLQRSLDVPIIMTIPEIVVEGEKKQRLFHLLKMTAAGAAIVVVVLILLEVIAIDLVSVAAQIGRNIRSMSL